MIILGVNCVYHECSAALVADGVISAAVEEERFNRVKHGKKAAIDNAHQIPTASIEYCLKTAGIKPGDIDCIALSFSPELRRKTHVVDPLAPEGQWGSKSGEKIFLDSIGQTAANLSGFLGEDVSARIKWIPHHIAHAASAYYVSGEQEAAILVVDGIGEYSSSLLAAGDGRVIRPIMSLDYPHSLGFLWEKFSKHLGFSEYDACKVMGLAAYGEQDIYRKAFQRFVKINGGGFSLDANTLEFRREGHERLARLLRASPQKHATLQEMHADIAATLQTVTNEIMLALADRLYAEHPSPALCMAGGVALNCQANMHIKEKGKFERIFIPCCPHDGGTSIGAALYCHHNESRDAGAYTPTPQKSPYSGPSYHAGQIEASLAKTGLAANANGNYLLRAAELIADGKIIGWFQGSAEFGPRALGNRSILADPRRASIRERINQVIKHREMFRPFGASVLEERAGDWFDLGKSSDSYWYMLFACKAHPARRAQVPAVIHVDGTSRIQTVNRQMNPLYHELIAAFERITSIPMVLNTSFNDREPMVVSPDHAIQTFVSSKLDALVINGALVEKPAPICVD